MKANERFFKVMHFESADQAPLWEWHPWPSTLRRWQREGVGKGNRPPQYAECDPTSHTPIEFWMLPPFETETLSDDGTYITRRTRRGVVERVPRSPDVMSMPEHVRFPVENREDWAQLKPRFDPDDPGRFPGDWAERCERWRRAGTVLQFHGARSPSLFGFVRELLGPERTLYAFYDEPDLVHDMMQTSTEVMIALLLKGVETAPLTTIFLWEDMCYKGGPLISPAMFREFMTPRYRRFTEAARGCGIDTVFVDSDGDVSELIPLWIEAGVNGVYPMEVAAGMDVVELRREYGRDLLMTGGIDKRVLSQSREAIDKELERCIPLAEQGGYIPHLDHAVPDDVSYDSFAYYWERKKQLLRVG